MRAAVATRAAHGLLGPERPREVRRLGSRLLQVRRHGEEGLHLLRPFWDTLARASRADSIFLSWEWQESWWRHYGPVRGRRACILSFHGPDERLLGIAPLYAERRSWNGIPLRTLALFGDGSGDGDDLDILALPRHETAVAGALLRHLHERGDWDVLDLHPVPHGSGTLGALRTLAPRRGWTCRQRELACSRTPLPGSWDELLAGLKPRLRSRARALLRDTVDGNGGRLERLDRARDLEQGLRILFDLHTRRWNAIGRPGCFADPARRDFFRDLAFRAVRNGWLRLYVLRDGERALAAQIGFVYRGVFLAIQEGFEPDAGERSPGVALRAAVLRACIHEGLTAYDNLLGAPPQKMRWAAQERRVVGLTLARARSTGSCALRLIDVGRGLRDAWRSRRGGAV